MTDQAARLEQLRERAIGLGLVLYRIGLVEQWVYGRSPPPTFHASAGLDGSWVWFLPTDHPLRLTNGSLRYPSEYEALLAMCQWLEMRPGVEQEGGAMKAEQSRMKAEPSLEKLRQRAIGLGLAKMHETRPMFGTRVVQWEYGLHPPSIFHAACVNGGDWIWFLPTDHPLMPRNGTLRYPSENAALLAMCHWLEMRSTRSNEDREMRSTRSNEDRERVTLICWRRNRGPYCNKQPAGPCSEHRSLVTCPVCIRLMTQDDRDRRLVEFLDGHGYWFVSNVELQQPETDRAVAAGILQPVEALLRSGEHFPSYGGRKSYFYVRAALKSVLELPCAMHLHLVNGIELSPLRGGS